MDEQVVDPGTAQRRLGGSRLWLGSGRQPVPGLDTQRRFGRLRRLAG
jgi:hypothetical protein